MVVDGEIGTKSELYMLLEVHHLWSLQLEAVNKVFEEIKDIADRKMYKAKFHAGEVDVMILAQSGPMADLVIIDDNAAKKTAKYLGLMVIGYVRSFAKGKKV